jgi:ribonuclease Z
LGNNSRTEDVFIYGPPGIQKAVQGLSVIFPQLPFKYKVIELPIDQSSYTMCDEIHVHSLPVDHGDMPCLSYSFELKRKGEFLVEKARGLQIPVSLWKKLQFGEPVMMGNQVIVPSDVLGPDRKGLKISYCTDTRPLDSLVEFVRDSDLFICEGNYAEDNKLNKAMEHGHMIFSEAAQLAAKAKVRELWLTHFSPALTDPHQFIDNAYNFFADSHVGTDLKMKNFVFL